MDNDDQNRRDRLAEKFQTKFNKDRSYDWWPWWVPLDAHKGDWDSRALELEEECRTGAGSITSYFVDQFLDVARWAIPIIDEIDGTGARERT